MNTKNIPQTHCTVPELAARFGIPKATVYTWIRNKRLPHLKIGRTVVVSFADLEKLRVNPEEPQS